MPELRLRPTCINGTLPGVRYADSSQEGSNTMKRRIIRSFFVALLLLFVGGWSAIVLGFLYN